VPLLEGSDDDIISENIKTLKREGKSEEQAVAIAMSKAKRDKPVKQDSDVEPPNLERGKRSVDALMVDQDRYERNPKKGMAKPGIHWSEQRDADAYAASLKKKK